MIKSDFKHEQSILSDENFFTLTNQNPVIKKVLTSIKSFKRNSELESDLSNWKNIEDDDSNDQNFFNWFSTELSLMNKILNKKLCQSELIMFKALDSDENYFQKSQ